MISPGINVNLFDNLVDQRTTVFTLDNVPRTLFRAQSYDILSSQANIAGYPSALKISHHLRAFLYQ